LEAFVVEPVLFTTDFSDSAFSYKAYAVCPIQKGNCVASLATSQ